MPGISAERLTVGTLREGADVFGSPEPDRNVPVRVAVSVPVCLSFPELLGLLVFGTGSLLTGDLNDETAIGEELQAALLMADLFVIENNARRAMDAYRGREGYDTETVAFARAVAVAITRMFGLPAPAGPDADEQAGQSARLLAAGASRAATGAVRRVGPWGDES